VILVPGNLVVPPDPSTALLEMTMPAVIERFRRSLQCAIPALAAATALALGDPPARAADFAPITDAERALTAAPGDPTAPAVVLFERGRLKLLEWPKDMFSMLEVETRVKVLDDRGKEMFGEIEIRHGKHLRLGGFKGRTVLPDGRVVPVGEDAIFVDTTSRSRKRYVTKAAFPAVEPGAILDYKYTLRWDGFLTFEPWYFANRVPTLRSEITYIVPPNLGAKPWGRQVGGVELHVDNQRRATGTHVTVWAENVPGVPDEPWSFPFEDLSSRFMLVPTEIVGAGFSEPLLQSWASTCDLAQSGYQEMGKNKGAARRTAKELTAAIAGMRPRVETIYRFVRDEIQHDGFIGVFAGGDDGKIDRVLADRRGSAAEQALVLEEMLDAIGAKPRLVWAADRLDGRIDTSMANPWWFERVLVMVELDGERVFLDPIDRNLGFGQFAPGFEGMEAVVYHPSKPEVIELPSAPPAANARRAELHLAVDAEGRVAGTGTMTLTGHHAWVDRSRGSLDGDQDSAERWRRQLEGAFPGYRISAVEVTDALDQRRLTVTWELALRDEEVLGDEVMVMPSRPIGPQGPVFALPEASRRTPVQLPFADVEEVELTLGWPEGWSVESAPESVEQTNPAGSSAHRIEIDEAARTLRYHRRVELLHSEFGAGPQYAALRQISSATEKADARPLVLTAR
jgi:hypothetical protein